MKKILLAILAFASVFGASAQKTDRTKIDYEVEMLPLDIISKERKFSITVEYDYAAITEAANAEVTANKEAAAKEKADYEKKSFGEKLGRSALLGESKPSGNFLNQKFIPTLFPVDGIKGQINIPGYKKAPVSNGTINVSFFEFKYTLDATQTKISYTPLKIVLTVTNDKGEVTFQGEVPKNSSSITYTSKSATDMNSAYLSTLRSCETDAKNQAIKNLNNYLMENYGFNLVKNERPFYDVKDKKMSYPEYHEAFEKVKTAFIYCNMASKQAEMVSKLKEAITIWENSLKELDKTNKNARINADIAAATYLNIAEASTWIKDFDKSIESLASYKLLGEDYSNSYRNSSEFLKDYSARYNKYMNY